MRPHQQTPLRITDDQLAKIIYSRVHNDILGYVKKELESSGCMKMLQNGAGLVLTGGGSKLRHIIELCQYDLGLNTRPGIPCVGFSDSLSNELKQPQYSTALGLLKYGIEQQTKDIHVGDDKGVDVVNETSDDFIPNPKPNPDEEDRKGRRIWGELKNTLTTLFEQIS